MGAYLSEPKTDKITTEEQNEFLAVCAGSMQGWRTSQEDAHNSILNYDANTSFFAVYDGHGGAEVSTYSADKLPEFLKSLESYKNGNIEYALKEAFLCFDKTLLESDVIKILKILSGEERPENAELSEEEDVEDLVGLHEESHLSLKEVLKRYKAKEGGENDAADDHVVDEEENVDANEDDSGIPGTSMPYLKRLKDSGQKPQSPYLRGRRAAAVIADAVNKAVLDADAKPEGPSTSAAAAAALSLNNDAGPSSSVNLPTVKVDTEEPEEDSTVSSSSSSASKSTINANAIVSKNANSNVNTIANANAKNNNKIPSSANNHDANAEAASKHEDQKESVVISNGDKNANESTAAPDSSHTVKENEQNGSVTSSEAKSIIKEPDVTTTSATATSTVKAAPAEAAEAAQVVKKTYDAIVSGSNEASEQKLNGSSEHSGNAVASSSTSGLLSVGSPVKADLFAISSTSKDMKKIKRAALMDDYSTDDDADYEGGSNSSDEDDDENAFKNSSDDDDEDDDADDEVDDDDDDDDDMDDDDDERRMEDDEETVMANQEFAESMEEEPGKDSGCTAVVAVLHGRDLYVANAGDSRCVVCRNGRAIDMSVDHKPEDEKESERILKAGGRVTCDGRVNGGLNLSRAFGDHAYKMRADLPLEEQMISPLPEIKKLIITADDEFMVLACDGIWNYMSSDDVVNFVRERLPRIDYQGQPVSKICEELFDHCLAPSTMGDGTGCDNMTAVIVRFKPKLQELATKINPEETEDVISLKPNATVTAASGIQVQSSDASSLKRMASSSLDEENLQSNKRMKTDSEVETSTLATSSNIATTTTSSQSSNCAQATSAVESISSSPAASLISTTEAASVADANECDSGITESSEAAAASA